MRYLTTMLVYIGSACTIAACSGGGGSGGQTPPPVNSAPSITSSASVSTAENSSGAFYTASATDPEGDPITFSISGTDSNAFTIDGQSGNLSFNSAPDFEAPSDSNSDNVYNLSITAADTANASSSINLSVTVTDTSDQRYVEEIFSGVDVQRNITFAPGLTMDVFTPSGDTESSRPLMIAASGGGFVRQAPGEVEYIALAFARRGYVAVTMNYTVLNTFTPTQDQLAVGGVRAVHDMFAAIRFMRATAQGTNQFGVNGNAIFVSGESAGGVMSMIAATIDETDTIGLQSVRSYFANNGGIFGNIGDDDSVSSAIQGAMPMSGAVLDLSNVDGNSAPMFAAHEEFDPVVPCFTAAEGSSNTGLVVSGACDVVQAYQNIGGPAELFLVEGSTGHVAFTSVQQQQIIQGAAELFFREVISN